ncbi:nitrogen fixation protein NifR [Staphylococcus aureus]|nr:nitrogen fixation protein NifR [Staphylococcus aureus]
MCKLAGPNIENFKKKFYRQCQVGERGPNTEGDEKSAYNNVQVGGPQHREFQKKFYRQCKLDQRNKFYENIISIPLLRITT